MPKSVPSMKGEAVPPKPASMVESLRDIGYSLEAAVADIIDNSITAGAKSISIRHGWEADRPWLAVLDDGRGMSEDVLIEAMRPGGRSPREIRDPDDLGRFGLGLKTASFSQARRLSVVSRANKITSARQWDLDEVVRLNEWMLFTIPATIVAKLPAIEELGPKGTYVLWDGMDRLDLGPYGSHAHALMNERLDHVSKHLELVFHRFLSPEPGHAKVKISVNGNALKSFDPFNAIHAATDRLPAESVAIDGVEVILQAYILPHHSKVSRAEYEKSAGPEGYLRSQGFYVYRARRLIRHGTWFRLCRQEELTKLARVQIDIPNKVDHLWAVDVRKSRANPPEAIRVRMRQIIERIRGSAKRPYVHRGSVAPATPRTAVWIRRAFNDRICYEINPSHPLIEDLRSDLDEVLRGRFDMALKMIASSLPTAMVFNDMGSHPQSVDSPNSDQSLLLDLARLLRSSNPRATIDEFRSLLKTVEPFASWPHSIDRIVAQLEVNL